MTATTVLLICRLLVLALFLATVTDWARTRDPRRRDIALMMATLGVPTLTGMAQEAIGLHPDNWTTTLGNIALMAHPWTLIRLAQWVRPMPRGLLLATTAATAISAVGLAVSGNPVPRPVAWPMVIYFLGAEGWAAKTLLQGAAATSGVTRRRLILAASGSATLASIILYSGFVTDDAAQLQEAIAVISMMGLLMTLLYWLGFAPPRFLVEAWQQDEFRRFLVRSQGGAPVERAKRVLEEVGPAAMRAVGGTAALVTEAAPDSDFVVVAASAGLADPPERMPLGAGLLGRAHRSGLPARGDLATDAPGPAERELARAAGAEGMLVVPLRADDRSWGQLVVLQSTGSLFPESDLAMLALLADQAALAGATAHWFRRQEAAVQRLRQLNAELTRASRHKSEFLANMSHELRTPLNAVMGFAQLMADGAVGPLHGRQGEFLGDILTSAGHLARMIDDVLDLAKIEAGRMELRPEIVDAHALVADVVSSVGALAAERKLELTSEVETSVGRLHTDPTRLRQILLNYLSNAIKFTPEGGSVKVRLLAARDGCFRVEVADSGIGIRDEDMARLFNEFEQLDASKSKRYAGTGLGLALTKRIVEAQGGSVEVRSEAGLGSTFSAVLPTDLEEGTISAARVPTVVGQPRILVIEDEPADRGRIVRILSEAGFATDDVSSGRQALRRIQSADYAAITLDLVLPDFTGWELLAEMRKRIGQDLPVLVITVMSDGQVNPAALAVSDILPKPIDGERLLASLRACGLTAQPLGLPPTLPTTPATTEPAAISDDPQTAPTRGSASP